MGWTQWKKLANKFDWHPENLSYDGPACYELGIKGKWKHYVIVTYVGNTGNLNSRMYQYAQNGSHLKKLLKKYWKFEYTLWFRYFQVNTKNQAVRMERNRLSEFGLERYPWNSYLGGVREHA